MKLRMFMGLGFLLAAVAVAILALMPDFNSRVDDLLMNLTSELAGICLTVFIIDYLLEKRREQEAVRRLARETLYDLDHHVWVWQGGARAFNLAELMARIADVRESDPLPYFTQSMFLNLGTRAFHTLQINAEVVELSQALRRGLEALTNLEQMRDADTPLKPKEIAAHLDAAARNLAQAAALALPDPDPPFPLHEHRTSEEDQEWRNYGRHRHSS